MALQSGSALADTAVLPVERRNVAPGDADVIGRLLADAYAAESGDRVVAPRAGASEDDFSVAPADEAKRLGADEYVIVYAVGLGERVKLRATRYALDGSIVYSASMDAASLDDMDVVTERLASALWRKVAPVETRTHQNVTRAEGRAPNRLFTEKVLGVKSGYFLPLATEVKLEPVLGLGFDARLETESYFIEFGAGVLLPSDSSDDRAAYGGVYSEFGASYYLTSSEVSPYVGAGVLPRLLFSLGGGAQFGAYGQLGLMFMRSHSTRLYADVRVAQNLTSVVVERRYDDSTQNYEETRVRPLELGLQVGVGW